MKSLMRKTKRKHQYLQQRLNKRFGLTNTNLQNILDPERTAKEDLIQIDSLSPQKRLAKSTKNKNIENVDISGWFDRYIGSNFNEQCRENQLNVKPRHGNLQNDEIEDLSQTCRYNTPLMESSDNRKLVPRAVSSGQSRIKRYRFPVQQQSTKWDQSVIPKLKKILKQLQSPEKKYTQRRDVELESVNEQDCFIEKIRKKRRQTMKVEDILRSKEQKEHNNSQGQSKLFCTSTPSNVIERPRTPLYVKWQAQAAERCKSQLSREIMKEKRERLSLKWILH